MIDLDALTRDAVRCGLDERLTRAILILANHTNIAINHLKVSLEESLDERIETAISNAASREAYYKALEGS